MDNVSSKSSSSSSSSPPATPTLSEPMEKRLRNDAADIYVDGDEESQQSSTDSNKLSAPQPDPSFESIISMEDEEFASDDEKVR